MVHLGLQRVVGGEIVRIQDVQPAGVLRVGVEEKRQTRGKLGDRLGALEPLGQGRRQPSHRIQAEVGGVQPPHHLRTGLAGVEA